MTDAVLSILIVVAALVIVAYMVRLRGKTPHSDAPDSKRTQQKNRWVRFSNIAVAVALLLLVLGFFMLRSVFILWISITILLLALVVGQFLKNLK
jgi:hypothetical protein